MLVNIIQAKSEHGMGNQWIKWTICLQTGPNWNRCNLNDRTTFFLSNGLLLSSKQ